MFECCFVPAKFVLFYRRFFQKTTGKTGGEPPCFTGWVVLLNRFNFVLSRGLIFILVWCGCTLPSTRSRSQFHRPPRLVIDPPVVVQGGTVSIQLIFEEPRWLVDQVQIGKRNIGVYELNASTVVWVRRALFGVAPNAPVGEVRVIARIQNPSDWIFQINGAFEVVGGTFPVQKIKLSRKKKRLLSSGKVRQDSKDLAEIYTQPSRVDKMWHDVFSYPTKGRVTSVYGASRTYGKGVPGRQHRGMDIANKKGTPIKAPAPGLVVFSGDLKGLGRTILLDHGHEVFTVYHHMSRRLSSENESVDQGQKIGEMGATGLATGSHLHWGVVVNGERVNPVEWTKRYIE